MRSHNGGLIDIRYYYQFTVHIAQNLFYFSEDERKEITVFFKSELDRLKTPRMSRVTDFVKETNFNMEGHDLKQIQW
jgi:hypothetical protein